MPVLKIKKNGVWEHVSGISEHTHLKDDIIGLKDPIYKDNEAPADPQEGDLWLDTDEEAAVSGGTVTDEQIASAVEDYMAEHPNSSQNPTGTKVYVTLADDGTIVIAPDVGDGLTNGVTITASLADDGTIVIGGE